MTRSLDGRAAIIAGASLGLGREVAAEYLRHGASIAICARDEVALEAARTHLLPLVGEGQSIFARSCDVSRPEQVEAFTQETIETFPHVDVLVNSAGVYGPKGLIEDNPWTEWVRAIEIDLFGAVLLCRAIVPHLKQRGYGKIIQLSGGGATQPLSRLSAYATAKAAVVRFAETLAVEVSDDRIDVNCIAPGALNTRMLDEVLDAGPQVVGEEFYRRAVQQRDSGGAGLERGAQLAVFLASAASDGITGRLISAVWDPWESLQDHRAELAGSDIYTLRRVVPGDRGKPWGNRT